MRNSEMPFALIGFITVPAIGNHRDQGDDPWNRSQKRSPLRCRIWITCFQRWITVLNNRRHPRAQSIIRHDIGEIQHNDVPDAPINKRTC